MAINRRARREAGFSLLETIVAMVLICTLGASLFLWLNNSLSSLYRVRVVEEQNAARLNILEYSKSINPMAKSLGRQDFGDYQAEWSAKPLTEIMDASNYPSGTGLYQVALYEIRFNVAKADGSAWFDLSVKQPGFKKVRSGILPFSGQ